MQNLVVSFEFINTRHFTFLFLHTFHISFFIVYFCLLMDNEQPNTESVSTDPTTSVDNKKEQKKSIKRCLGNDQKNNSDWPKCMFWLAKCHRYCSWERAPGSLYCVNHYFSDTNQEKDDQDNKKRRVPCPLDPSHSVYEYKLKKHLKICNKAKSLDSLHDQPYYQENRNVGGDTISEEFIHHQHLSALIKRIQEVYSSILKDHVSENMHFPESLESYVEEKKKENIKHEKLRHVYQQGTIINNMKEEYISIQRTRREIEEC